MHKASRVWSLQEAKAKFSEVVRLAQSEGDQVVTVHGKPAVVIRSAEMLDEPPRKRTGRDLVRALQSCPVPDFEIPERDEDASFRDVEL